MEATRDKRDRDGAVVNLKLGCDASGSGSEIESERRASACRPTNAAADELSSTMRHFFDVGLSSRSINTQGLL